MAQKIIFFEKLRTGKVFLQLLLLSRDGAMFPHLILLMKGLMLSLVIIAKVQESLADINFG
jgi:hypothetical protein